MSPQVTGFDIVLYWMTGLKATADAFFTFWFITLLATFVCNPQRGRQTPRLSASVLHTLANFENRQ